MEVKIYREPENKTLIFNEDDRAAYHFLAKKLGIKDAEEKDEKQTPIVYPYLNKGMEVCLNELCPMHTDLKDYKKSTIPLEVLKVVEFVIDNEMFEGIAVWYDDVDPDPLLIGWNYEDDTARENKYGWRKDRYLLARWGDCAMELNDLLAKGKEALKERVFKDAKKALVQVKLLVENPDSLIDEALKGNSKSVYIYNSSSIY